MPWRMVEPACDYNLIRGLCYRPYRGHPRGCPNYGKKRGCPPSAPLLHEVIDLARGVWAVWNEFPLGEHARRMHRLHPRWSDRQQRNCLYWQPRARKQLRLEVARFLGSLGTSLVVVPCPEACGVNLTETMKRCGIALDWPPRETAYQIVLAGTKA